MAISQFVENFRFTLYSISDFFAGIALLYLFLCQNRQKEEGTMNGEEGKGGRSYQDDVKTIELLLNVGNNEPLEVKEAQLRKSTNAFDL